MSKANEKFDKPLTLKDFNNKISSLEVHEGFGHFAGKALDNIVEFGVNAGYVGAIFSGFVYGAMTMAYGPYDAGKVIYSEVTGKNLKHLHVEEAKGMYARKVNRPELTDVDIRNLYMELGVASSEGKKPVEDDISWYHLLDWIEAND